MSFVACLVLSSVFALEWNTTYQTDVPYEVELNPEKIGARSFAVSADGRPIDTTVLRGKAPGTLIARFKVPAGTKGLSCAAADGEPRLADAAVLDNLFAGVLEASGRAKWKVPKGVEVSCQDGGLLFSATKGAATVSVEVDVPDGLAGAPVAQEMCVVSKTPLCWGEKIRIVQLDAGGRPLPESVADQRWTSHMRPPEKPIRYFDYGALHPRAARLRAEFALRPVYSAFDDFGLEIKDPAKKVPRLLVTRLAVRPADRLPFPKWDDACFAPGVSGKPGDYALAFGGKDGKALFYQTRSRGCWSDSHQFRSESDLYFPSGAGTVEAWFRPDWKAVATPASVILFEAYNSYRAAERLQGIGSVFSLRYDPKGRSFLLRMKDWKSHAFEKRSAQCPFPDGAWSHVAVQWKPGDRAQVFLNGRVVLDMPIPAFEAVPLADESVKVVNDVWDMEFFLGSCYGSARDNSGVPPADRPIFEGAVDLFRASTGLRYADGFAPAREFAVDADTRALFSFDRAFDGVSGGGYGRIPASYHRHQDRVDHRLSTDRGVIQYYPAENRPDNDPFQVFDILNYPTMPTVAEYRRATRTLTRQARLSPGEKLSFKAGAIAYPEYVEFENESKTIPVEYPILVGRGRLDPRSFGDLARSLGNRGLSDKEKANAVFQYALQSSDYFMNHQLDLNAGTDRPHCACGDAMIMLNSYCGFECGPLNNLTANMLSTVAGCPACQTGGYGHSFQQVFFDGKNHIYDLSAQKFFPSFDNETSVYLEEAADQPCVFNRVKYSGDHFIRRSTRGTWVENVSYQEKVALVLNPGERVRLWYANDGRMHNLQTWSRTKVDGSRGLTLDQYDFSSVAGQDASTQWVKRMDRIFPEYATAVVLREGPVAASNPAIEQLKPDSFCYRVRSCYPVVWGEYAALARNGRPVEIEMSTDFGKTFRALPADGDGVYRLEYLVKGRHDYLLRVKASVEDVADLRLRTEGEVNSRTYPGWVRAGENELEYRAESAEKAKVTVAWREPAQEIVVGGGVYQGTIPGQERQVVLLDPAAGLSLPVGGLSSEASVRTFGRVRASLDKGVLRLGYDAGRPLAMTRGGDLEAWYAKGGPDVPARREFPTVAGVEITDGGAVKRLTVVVSPNARLVTAAEMEVSGGRLAAADASSVQDRVVLTRQADRVTVPTAALPAGRYQVFALARYTSHPKGAVKVLFEDPSDARKTFVVSRPINGCEDYLKAKYAHKGERSRWKWDTVNLEGREYGQTSWSGWIINTIDFPATDRLVFSLSEDEGDGVELAAVLVLPDPDLECRNDLRKILFGLNCQPFR